MGDQVALHTPFVVVFVFVDLVKVKTSPLLSISFDENTDNSL